MGFLVFREAFFFRRVGGCAVFRLFSRLFCGGFAVFRYSYDGAYDDF